MVVGAAEEMDGNPERARRTKMERWDEKMMKKRKKSVREMGEVEHMFSNLILALLCCLRYC